MSDFFNWDNKFMTAMSKARQFGREGDMPGKSFSAPLNQTLNLLSSFGLLFWACIL